MKTMQSQRRISRRRIFRRGFTLVELLMVIVVISILVALILPALRGASRNVRVTEVKTEIEALDRAIADFKAVFGVEPPSRIVLYEQASGWTNTDPETRRSKALIRRLWPQFDFTINRDINRDGDTDDVIAITGAECLVFFLGGLFIPNNQGDFTQGGAMVGFSKNPANPFSFASANSARVGPFHEFKPNRLVILDPTGRKIPSYLDPLPDQSAPILYLSSYEGRGYEQADLAVFGDTSLDMSNVYRQNSNNGPPWNGKSYQIISPGFDGRYGVGGKFDPNTAETDLTGNREPERDNITNFHNSTLATP
jgi:prepilin-type N-terminal cleavage/methylation domain-containing protein